MQYPVSRFFVSRLFWYPTRVGRSDAGIACDSSIVSLMHWHFERSWRQHITEWKSQPLPAVENDLSSCIFAAVTVIYTAASWCVCTVSKCKWNVLSRAQKAHQEAPTSNSLALHQTHQLKLLRPRTWDPHTTAVPIYLPDFASTKLYWMVTDGEQTRCPNAHDTLAGNSLALECSAGNSRWIPARVATKFALLSSASFQLWHPSTAL